MTDLPDNTGQKLDSKFKKGLPSANPNGRPRGSRNAIVEKTLKMVCDDIETHGVNALVAFRLQDPGGYWKMVAQLWPKKIENAVEINNTFAQFNLTDPREFAAAWEIARKVVYGQAPMIEADEGVAVTEAWRADEDRLRPTLPWYLEEDVHAGIAGDNNPFLAFTTPAAIMVYFATELPGAMRDLLQGVVDAGAGATSLYRDAIELAEMGHGALAEAVYSVAEQVDEPQTVESARGIDIGETDFEPPSLKNANHILGQAVAAISKMKVRERLEGVPVQEREN
jgi:hypothetical protein